MEGEVSGLSLEVFDECACTEPFLYGGPTLRHGVSQVRCLTSPSLRYVSVLNIHDFAFSAPPRLGSGRT